MCGNGGRCAARFAFINGIAGDQMSFGTLAGTMKAKVDEDGKGKAAADPADRTEARLSYPLGDREIFVSSVNTGVPHAILLTDHVDRRPSRTLGRRIRYHKAYPKGTNVDFVEVLDARKREDQDLREGCRRRDVCVWYRGGGGRVWC